jgi:DNA-binding winged helix-turn-helix (wHTH) protein
VPTGARFVFEPFELDTARRLLTLAGEPVGISYRQLDVLLTLVARAGQIVSKDDLLEVGWKDVAVGDNSVEQVISSLRRLLGAHASGVTFIETVARRGYRFTAAVTRKAPRESDAGLDALLAPHRAFIEGRAALETLDGSEIARAREVFQGALSTAPEHASAHVGLANACVMQFEMTRADPEPDIAALSTAAGHAREACRLDPQLGEAWATLGFVLNATGQRIDALAASKRAVTLEPDNWRHHFRLSYVSWGEERLRAAHRTLALFPDFPQAHWLAATVHVARQALDEAERELTAAIAPQATPADGRARFSSVASHWLLGLVHLARGDQAQALAELERELSFETSGHLYARECCANTCYAIGAIRLRQGRLQDAAAAFEHAVDRVKNHPMARMGLGVLQSSGAAVHQSQADAPQEAQARRVPSLEAAFVRAALLIRSGAATEAARIVEEALAVTAAGSAGWLLPVEPFLNVVDSPAIWTRALALLRNRAA